MGGHISQELFNQVPIWYFEQINKLTDEEYQLSDELIKEHIDNSVGTIQIKGTKNSKEDIFDALNKTKKLGYCARFIHVWEGKSQSNTDDPNTISIFYLNDI